jgi:hypothetical protein
MSRALMSVRFRGVERTSRFRSVMSAFDPKRTRPFDFAYRTATPFDVVGFHLFSLGKTMKRHEFIALLDGAATVLSRAARAQPTHQIPKIGWLKIQGRQHPISSGQGSEWRLKERHNAPETTASKRAVFERKYAGRILKGGKSGLISSSRGHQGRAGHRSETAETLCHAAFAGRLRRPR